MSDTFREHPPLVVIANSQEWHTRSLESILGPHGYAVLRAYTGQQALERCRSARPDIIIIDTDLPDIDGLEICRSLREDPLVSRSTPILVTCPGHSTRKDRLAALRAGAWEFLGSALDSEELPLRLDAYVSAKFESDRARDESLLDQLTGLYNVQGLARRARELGSLAFRHHKPLACVVFSPVPASAQAGSASEAATLVSAERLAKVLRERTRLCDATGRLGPTEFAVIAQGTDAAGAVLLAERLMEGMQSALPGDLIHGEMRVAAGFDAVPNYHESPLDPAEMLVRATMAMRQSRAATGGQWIRQFEASGIPN